MCIVLGSSARNSRCGACSACQGASLVLKVAGRYSMYSVDVPTRIAFMVLEKLVTVLVTCIWRVLVVVSSLGTSGCCHRPATAAKSREGNRITASLSGGLVVGECCCLCVENFWKTMAKGRQSKDNGNQRTSSCKQETKRDTQRNARKQEGTRNMQEQVERHYPGRPTIHTWDTGCYAPKSMSKSPCHMLCAFCMRANHSSCFQTQPYLDMAFIVAAFLFVDQT
jgi:hypothetical protein